MRSLRRRGLAVAVLALAGLAAAGYGGYNLRAELTRHATAAEARTAEERALGSRWLRLPAGQIFRLTVGYTNTASGAAWTARLVGIAPRVPCAAAADPAVATILARSGCQALLRATYADVSGTLVTTIGIAVMPDEAAAGSVLNAVQMTIQRGIRAVSFPGTVSGRFGDPQRAAFGALSQGPYVFLYAAGFADGRVTHRADNDSPLTDLGDGVASALAGGFTASGHPCQDSGIRC